MSNEVAVANTSLPAEFNMLQVVARNAALSGMYKKAGGEPQIFMLLLAARELGVSPMLALNGGLWMIEGKVEVSARLMNLLIRRNGHSVSVVECSSAGCTLEGKRADNGDTFRASFTKEDAIAAKLHGKDNWIKYAEDMMFARALSRLARRLFPDVIGNVYVEGELQDRPLERSDYDITPPTPVDYPLLPGTQNVCVGIDPELKPMRIVISAEQSYAMRIALQPASDEFRGNFYKLIVDRYGAKSIDEVPASKYEMLMEAIKRNTSGAPAAAEGGGQS